MHHIVLDVAGFGTRHMVTVLMEHAQGNDALAHRSSPLPNGVDRPVCGGQKPRLSWDTGSSPNQKEASLSVMKYVRNDRMWKISVKNQWSCTNWLYLQINPLEGVIDSFSVKYLYAHSKNMFTTTSSVFNRQSYFVSHIATNCKLARKSEKHQPNTQSGCLCLYILIIFPYSLSSFSH